MTNAERQRELVEALGDHLAEYLEKNLPVTIALRPLRLRFDVYGTDNEAMMRLAFKGPGEVGLKLDVYRKDTDRLYSNYLPSASGEEMLRYLRDPVTHRAWLEQIAHLSQRVDDYWD